MKKIAALIVDRANYGRLKPLLLQLKECSEVELSVICSGTMLLERFGKAEDIVKKDGFEISSRVYIELEGSNPITMAKSLGIAILEFTNELSRLKPDMLLVIGDRYEALGAVLSAAYLNICIVHLQGGEVSGSIDESARHAMTKFAHYHFPATERSQEYLIRMGEDPQTVFNLGCPVVDVIHELDKKIDPKIFQLGVGFQISEGMPYNLVIYHPTTTLYGKELEEIDILLDTISTMDMPTLWLWPNIDAGSDNISKRIRHFREINPHNKIRFIKNLTPEHFQKILHNANCAIGNSSSFVRDASFMGVPVILLGSRQDGRETGPSTIATPVDRSRILEAYEVHARNNFSYPSSNLYGEPGAAKRIAEKILQLPIKNVKKLHYTVMPQARNEN